MNKLSGTGVAMVTPFHRDGNIDFKSLQKLIKHVISGRAGYIVLLGTTGESVTLTKDEKLAVIGVAKETVNGKIPIVLGLGGNNTQEIINCLKTYDMDGIEAILSVSPYYNKPSQRGILEHYKRIADASPVPVIIYNVPGRTSSNISAATTLQLAHEENIIGVKEASGNFSQCMQIIKNRPDGFLVISGDDALTLPLLTVGADGVISVVANAFPSEFSAMVNYAMTGETEIAKDFHYLLFDLIENLFAEGSPAGIKAVLEILGICANNLRLPLVGVSKNLYAALSENIRTIKKQRKKAAG